MNRRGKLYFRYGTMGSAKTALLLTQAYNFEERGMSYACLKPVIDTRERAAVIRSRIGIERQCSWIYPETDIYALAQQMFEDTMSVIDWFLVDEAQFLSPEQVDDLFRLAVLDGIPVIAYGLRSDFRTRGFPGSLRLMELAHSIEELKTVCRCGRKATLNARTVDGSFTQAGSQVAIEGEVGYESMCGTCYLHNVGTLG